MRILLLVLHPLELLVNLMVRLAGMGGLARLLPKLSKQTMRLADISLIAFHYLQSI
jgi:hypothetical protein